MANRRSWRTTMLMVGCLLAFRGTSLALGAEDGAEARGPRIETVAGTGKPELGAVGDALKSNVSHPFGVEIGPDGGLYICEVGNHRILRLDRATGDLTIVAGTGEAGYAGDGGPATEAKLNEPYELRFDSQGHLYVVEMQNHVVRRIDAGTKIIETVAGCGQLGFEGDGGPATNAKLNRPHSIALDQQQRLFIADIGNHRIRVVDLNSGIIETFAGNGEKQLPKNGQAVAGTPVLGPRALYYQKPISFSESKTRPFHDGNLLYVALREGNSVWSIDLSRPAWKHIAGTGVKGSDNGQAAQATFNGPKGIAVGNDGQIYVVDTENDVIRAIDAQHQRVRTVAGLGRQKLSGSDGSFGGDGGVATSAFLNRPHGICVDANRNLYIGDSENHRVRRVIQRVIQNVQPSNE